MLTPIKAAVIRFVDAFGRERGYQPTLAEIAHGVGLGNRVSVYWHVSSLAEDGYLTRGRHMARSVCIGERGREWLKEREAAGVGR